MATNKLTAIHVRNLTEPGRYNDGAGLYLYVNKTGGRAWVFRYRDRITGKHRDKGLGPVADVTLEHARQRAHSCRLQLLDDIDPIEAANVKRAANKLEIARRVSFGECCERYIEAHRAGWRNKKHAAQWTSTLNAYAALLMPLPVADVDTALVMKCLEPEWAAKPETMSRVRQRIEAVLAWATARRFRGGDNPARWRGHLEHMLAKRSKIAPVKHRPALAYAEIGVFMAELRGHEGIGAKALELQILTATRPGEAAGAQWAEFDLQAAIWTIPAARMKAAHEHRIPLSAPAIGLLGALARINGNVLPGVKGKPVTTAASLKLVKTLRPGLTAHGFRSTFRDWAGDMTGHPREIIEAAMAHRLKDKAEAAYRRGDAFERRVKLMGDWAAFCALVPRENVTPIRRVR
jgi:integrase